MKRELYVLESGKAMELRPLPRAHAVMAAYPGLCAGRRATIIGENEEPVLA
jgi:hypothetical protein